MQKKLIMDAKKAFHDFTVDDVAIIIYALGALHASVLKSQPNPIGIAMVRASFPLCKKLGINLDESVFDPNSFPANG